MEVSLLYSEILQYYTMILQRHRIIVGDAGFEPDTSAALPQKSGALTLSRRWYGIKKPTRIGIFLKGSVLIPTRTYRVGRVPELS